MDNLNFKHLKQKHRIGRDGLINNQVLQITGTMMADCGESLDSARCKVRGDL
ncbi:hypothetical protein [Reinekea marinisedimentorum]|uniref:Uncharacterized protein n=1 Tax=Reinekea marinisedimentorum TaxID=230495 RepID=A0A4R3I4V7_9GAMM|nr:hypothetical protein [Reinekea marinisedimentorum]TCS39019.1 hypothetical protein BCF53_11365 [Reinekea marinisedimentorum]